MAEGHLILLSAESSEMINLIGFGDSICDHNKWKVQLYVESLSFQVATVADVGRLVACEHLQEDGHGAAQQRRLVEDDNEDKFFLVLLFPL